MSTNTPAAEADRVLALLRPGPLSTDEYKEYTAIYGRDPIAVTQHAQALLMRAQLEEQRTANLIAFYSNDQFTAPPSVSIEDGSAKKWWAGLDGRVRRALHLTDEVPS